MYNLSVGLFFKTDHHYLREWVEYYRIIGIEHFYIVCNDNDPAPAYNILRPYIDRGIMTFNHIKGGPAITKQIEAHEWFLSKSNTKWLMVVDLDEFFFPVKEQCLHSMLEDYEHYGGVTANWMVYGSSGLYYPPELATESYTYRARESFQDNMFFKSITQTGKVLSAANPHSFLMKPGEFLVDELGRRIVDGSMANYNLPWTYKRLRVNHYRTRSWIDFQEKCKRWKGGEHPHFISLGCDGYFKQSDKNEVYDTVILRYVERIRHALSKL